MGCPYNKLELQEAVIQLCLTRDFSEEKINDLLSLLKTIFPKDSKEFNKKVAIENGITVQQLINSCNYSVLRDHYINVCHQKCVEKIESELKITKMQAWGVYLNAIGQLS